MHEIKRNFRDRQLEERIIAERLKNEYGDLRERLGKMASELRFSIEDELKIYAHLLDQLTTKSGTNFTTHHGGSPSGTTYTTTTTSALRSYGIEDRNTPDIFRQTKDTSLSNAPENTILDLGNSSSIFPITQVMSSEITTTNLNGNINVLRLGDRNTYNACSIARSSSYSHLN